MFLRVVWFLMVACFFMVVWFNIGLVSFGLAWLWLSNSVAIHITQVPHFVFFASWFGFALGWFGFAYRTA